MPNNKYNYDYSESDYFLEDQLQVLEKANVVVIRAPMPDLESRDIEVSYSDNMLFISAENYDYAATLSQHVDLKSMRAYLRDGYLSLKGKISPDYNPGHFTVRVNGVN